MKKRHYIGISIITITVYLAYKGFVPVDAIAQSLSSSTPQGAVSKNDIIPKKSGMIDEATVAQFTTLLATIKSITIDTTVFDNPAYKALRDNQISLGSDTAGRLNPFAPVGSDGGDGEANGSGGVSISSSQINSDGTMAAVATMNAANQVSVKTGDPSVITNTSARFKVIVTLPPGMNLSKTNTIPGYFRYGTTLDLENKTPLMSITKSAIYPGVVTGLQSGTKYYVQSIVTSDGIDIKGDILSFTTTGVAKSAAANAQDVVGLTNSLNALDAINKASDGTATGDSTVASKASTKKVAPAKKTITKKKKL